MSTRYMGVWTSLVLLGLLVVGAVALFATTPGSPVYGLIHRPKNVTLAVDGPGDAQTGDAAAERSLKIVTVLRKDAIRAILDPEFLTAVEADSQMDPRERVLGLSINGDHRAYSIPALSSHEVVNDVVGGKPVVVTW